MLSTNAHLPSQPDLIRLVGLLLRGLSHDIRTPLSVISNDLHYFGSLIDSRECERSIQKCAEIGSRFQSLIELISEPLMVGEVTSEDLVSAVREEWSVDDGGESVFSVPDKERTLFVISELAKLLTFTVQEPKLPGVLQVKTEETVLSVSCEVIGKTAGETSGQLHSFTALVGESSRAPFVTPPLADVLLQLLCAELCVEIGDGWCRATLRIPTTGGPLASGRVL